VPSRALRYLNFDDLFEGNRARGMIYAEINSERRKAG